MGGPVVVEGRSSPLAEALASSLRRASDDAVAGRWFRRLRGRVALRSVSDPQAATIAFARGRGVVRTGVHHPAVTITADLDRLVGPGARRPKVRGALRHPVLTVGVARVLDVGPRDWKAAVDEFWRRAEGRPGRPPSLAVRCSDDGVEVRLGDDGAPALTVVGRAEWLVPTFNGAVSPARQWYDGHLEVRGSTEVVQRFEGLAQDLMFGR